MKKITDFIIPTISISGISVSVILLTFHILKDYKSESIVIALALNLFFAHIIFAAIAIMGESFIEDVVKAILFSLVLIPLWFRDFKNIDFVRAFFLSIATGAWYPVLLKILYGSLFCKKK